MTFWRDALLVVVAVGVLLFGSLALGWSHSALWALTGVGTLCFMVAVTRIFVAIFVRIGIAVDQQRVRWSLWFYERCLWMGLVWLAITASHFMLARSVELAGQVSEVQTQSDRHGRYWIVTVQGSGWSNTTRYYWPTNSEKVVLSAGDQVHLNASQGWLWLDVHNLSSTQGLALNAALL